MPFLYWPAFVALALPAAAPPDALSVKLQTVLSRPEYRHARWGIVVVDADTGKPVFERNGDQLFAPASVTKLYTCSAALAVLGADHRFQTPVYQRGTLTRDGTLAGDLILVAQGDLSMGGRDTKDGKMAFVDGDHTYAGPTSRGAGVPDTNPLAALEGLARQIRKAGVRKVTGDVLIDARLFAASPSSGSGPRTVSPILINDTVVDVIVRPGAKAGDRATFALRPQTAFLRIDVQVQTVEKGKNLSITVERLDDNSFRVRGTIPAGAGPAVRICPVGDPVLFARALFIEALRREGVAVEASLFRNPTAALPEPSEKLQRLAVHKSLPLSEAVKVILKVSHNLMASTLPMLLAAKARKKTLAAGMIEEAKALRSLGVPVESISLESGAGGGNADRVTPWATVKLLLAMRKRPDWPLFEASLPVLGVDGTLAGVNATGKARGKARAKTGTYTDRNLLSGRGHMRAKSLAGVMTTAKGRKLVFCIFLNDVALPRGVTIARHGRALGELCELLYLHAP
jgi:D-alanyl-D-alanine carboxypeptidase/D-alanyl-D-alanine-endopeptidase (penicillin-binding protein 4)